MDITLDSGICILLHLCYFLFPRFLKCVGPSETTPTVICVSEGIFMYLSSLYI
jgi:hypothetical protein